jgi:NAD(P)-dependent dehydrogenase (short-subunit alcohol dehydrogenase family)
LTRPPIADINQTGRLTEYDQGEAALTSTETHTKPAPTATYPDLIGKVAVITGGSRQIGAATATDLTSTFLSVSTFLPDMLARHSGVIITMASAAARQSAKMAAAYAAAKSGVIAFSRHLAGECAHEGIRINCIAPSAIETDRMRSWVPEEQRRALGAAFPLGRIGQPEEHRSRHALLGIVSLVVDHRRHA